ncbi:MAG: hypothetical protein P8172_12585 [Gammaproteobacteria bacterium]|jgi:hypothetical protein
MRILIVTTCLMLLASAADAESTARLKVTATIPPPPCEYPGRCETSDRTAGGEVRVDGERILYSGTLPVVEQRDGVTTVLF